jgi:hypothetical protein
MRNIGLTLVATASISVVLSAASSDREGAFAREVTHRSYPVSDFHAVSSFGPNVIHVSTGKAVSVRAEGPTEAVDMIEVLVEAGALIIRPKQEHRKTLAAWEKRAPVFFITLPELEAARVTGAGDMAVDRVAGRRFSGSVGGPAELRIGNLAVDAVDLRVAGPGRVNAAGSAQHLTVSLSGTGRADLRELESATASVRVSGTGDVRARASGTADLSITGLGSIEISGGAACTVAKRGRGKIVCRS